MADKPDPKAKTDEIEEQVPEKNMLGLPLMKILIVAGVLLVQIVGSYFLQKTFLFDTVAEADAAVSDESAHEKSGGHGDEQGSQTASIVMLEEIVVNPAGTEGRRFLATKIGLQSTEIEINTAVEEKGIFIRDAVIALLSSKSLDELSSIAYRDTLRLEIMEAVNRQFESPLVNNIVFSDYVLQ